MSLSKLSLALLAAAALPIAAHADTFSGTAVFTDTSVGNNNVSFTGTFAHSPFSFTGGAGYTYTDALTIDPTSNLSGNNSASDTLKATFTFTLPNSVGASETGMGTIMGHNGGESNTISWDNGGVTMVSFADGSVLQITLPNFDFRGTGSDTEDAKFTVITNANAVPEPGSLALLGTGLLSTVAMLRRKIRA